MSIVGIIPARGGSKAIPKKNIALCAGRPLIAYTCDAARDSKLLSRTLVSTDSEDIAAVARAHGVEVPFLRPSEIADDTAPMIAVLQHALRWLRDQEGTQPEALLLLQPTSPLRTSKHIDEAIELFRRTKAETVVSVVEVPHQYNPVSLMEMNECLLDRYLKTGPIITRRQDKPKLYARNGPAILLLSPQVIERGELYGSPTMGYLMDVQSSHDIDEPPDLELVEFFLKKRS